MTERPATRADLRAVAWYWLRWRDALGPKQTECALHLIATLDADERDDPKAARVVAAWLARNVTETDKYGRPVALHWRDPVPA